MSRRPFRFFVASLLRMTRGSFAPQNHYGLVKASPVIPSARLLQASPVIPSGLPDAGQPCHSERPPNAGSEESKAHDHKTGDEARRWR